MDFKEPDKKTRLERNEIYRARDFLPWQLDCNIFIEGTDKNFANRITNNSGQAEKFAQFINNQVVPLIDEKFRGNQERTLIGHSFGGVFVIFMLLCYSQNFAKYLAIAPALASEYYAQKEMFDVLTKKLPTAEKLVYFSIGSEEKDDRMTNYIGAVKNACLEIGKTPNILSKFEIIEGENHASVVTPSIWRGLKFFNNIHNN